MEIKPKKSLGQNFLRDEAVLQKIIEASELNSDDFVIEVGPGEGVLTEQLAKHAKKVLAIELDDNLIPVLEKKFKHTKNVEIIHADILKINLPALVESRKSKVESYKVIANIPYYITSPIIRLFLETIYPPTEMILLVQKEVAQRICAQAGQMSVLAVSVQYYAGAEVLFYVDKKSFFPAPKVDSAVVKITKHNLLTANILQDTNRFKDTRYKIQTPNTLQDTNTKIQTPNNIQNTNYKLQTKHFFRIVKAGFSAKRKTLANNLASSLQLPKNIVEEKIKKIGFQSNVRAQELSVDDWKKLAELL